MPQRPEALLITGDKTIVQSSGATAKFTAKSAAWEESKLLLEGETMEVFVNRSRGVIVKRPAPAVEDPPLRQRTPMRSRN